MVLEIILFIEFMKAQDFTSPEANTNVWIFIVSTIACVVGFLAVQVWLQSGKLTGIKTNYEVLSGRVKEMNTKVDSLNSKLDTFLKAEIDMLKDLMNKRK